MTSKRGGKREGSGRKPAADPARHRGIRCTDGGWQWLKDQAAKAGASSIGKWADMKGKP